MNNEYLLDLCSLSEVNSGEGASNGDLTTIDGDTDCEDDYHDSTDILNSENEADNNLAEQVRRSERIAKTSCIA